MAKTAWMASKWGGSDVSAPAPTEGEVECGICMHAAVQIMFMPCKHGSCLPCIQRLRAENVFKVRSRCIACIMGAFMMRHQSRRLRSDHSATRVSSPCGDFGRPMQASNATCADSLWKGTKAWRAGAYHGREGLLTSDATRSTNGGTERAMLWLQSC